MLVSWNGVENNVKVVFLGESGVGKSSLATRFVSNEFFPYNELTVGANYLSKTMVLSSQYPRCSNTMPQPDPDSKKRKSCATFQTSPTDGSAKIPSITFKIWDTAGQERFHSLVPMYYRGAGAAVLVFDVTKPVSLHSLQKWVTELREKGPSDLVLVLCGNKSDLNDDRRINQTTAKDFATNIGAVYVEASAKSGEGVTEIFCEVAKRIVAIEGGLISQHPYNCTVNGVVMGSFNDAEMVFNTISNRTCC